MNTVLESLTGLIPFILYFSLSIGFLLIFKIIYVRCTPHDEWKLVKDDKNIAAAIALAGSIIGYSLAISGAARNAVNLIDFSIWGCIGLIAQLIAFLIIRVGFIPQIISRIEKGEIPAGIIMATTSIAIGLLNAACMSY
ncbi:TPA: DUF350 domain-containing protein [Photobacterium damselae]